MRKTVLGVCAALSLLTAGCSSNDTSTDTDTTGSSASAISTAASTAASTSAAESSRPSPEDDLYGATCADAKPLIDSIQELAKSLGEEKSRSDIADELLAGLMAPDESDTASGPEWDELTAEQQDEVRRALSAAADGTC